MKAALDLMIFLVGGIAVAAGTVAGASIAVCAVSGAGCWWWLRRRRRSR
jgi:hypothetical protein